MTEQNRPDPDRNRQNRPAEKPRNDPNRQNERDNEPNQREEE